MESIKNYDVYANGMKKSLEDKAFFLDMVSDADAMIDFGCADGNLLKMAHEKYPTWDFTGIDSDIKMIEKAKCNIPEVEFVCGKGIPEYSFERTYNAVLNMSSVIHEVYSYLRKNEIEKFWGRVFYSGFKYISIRDLAMGSKAYVDVNKEDLEKLISKADQNQLNDFTAKWGEIKLQISLVHFLLKYRYLENWDREVAENYFPITVERLLSIIPTDLYRIVYFEHYILPFNKYQIQKDFGIELSENTHVKILLERV